MSATTYWLLNRAFPVPATSEYWNEVGEQITEISLVEEDDKEYYDEESGSMESEKRHHDAHTVVAEAR